MKSKIFALLLIACLLCSCANKGSSSSSEIPVNAVPESSVSSKTDENKEKRIRFSATGDNLIHDGLYLQAAARAGGNGYDFGLLYQNVADFYKQFDVNWINQETLVNDELPPSSYPCFSTPGALGQAAYDVGFRVFAMSNNHSYDKGAQGILATLNFWDKMPKDVVTTGFWKENEYDNIPIQEINDVKIAYLAYTQYTNGIPQPQNSTARVILTDEIDLIERQIKKANELADFVIVGVHWGNEGSHDVTDGQKLLGQQMADFGADAIIGTHPHVIQTMEYLASSDGRSVPIAYSLGNFVSSQAGAHNLIGIVCSFDIVKDEDNLCTIQNLAATPVVTQYGANFANIREYLYDDYTDDLAASHGVRERTPEFSRAYINEIIEQNIPKEFLKYR